MKKIIARVGVGVLVYAAFAIKVFAAVPNWDIRGNWTFNDIYLSVPYVHSMTIDAFNPVTGDFAGHGYYTADSSLTWTISGNESGNTISYSLLTGGSYPGVTLIGTGNIDSATSMSGKGSQSNIPGPMPNVDWTAAGLAKPSIIYKDQCKKNGWKIFGMFKNEGDCVSFVATHYKTFVASDSLYYNCPSVCNDIYGSGGISFTWDKSTGNVIGGYYNEIVPPTNGTTYYNVVSGGTVSGSNVTLTFVRTNPNNYGPFTFTGVLTDDILTGQLDGPFYFIATGN